MMGSYHGMVWICCLVITGYSLEKVLFFNITEGIENGRIRWGK